MMSKSKLEARAYLANEELRSKLDKLFAQTKVLWKFTGRYNFDLSIGYSVRLSNPHPLCIKVLGLRWDNKNKLRITSRARATLLHYDNRQPVILEWEDDSIFLMLDDFNAILEEMIADEKAKRQSQDDYVAALIS